MRGTLATSATARRAQEMLRQEHGGKQTGEAADRRGSSRLIGEERFQHLLVIGFCIAISLIGWLMIVQGAEQIRVVRQVAQWPTTAGLIESVDLFEVEGSQGTQFRPHVSYSYVVDGQVIMGTRLAPGRAPAVRDFPAAAAFVAKYPARTPITVFYSPADATESVLEAETPRTVYVNLAFGIILAGLGPALLLFFGFPTRRPRPAPVPRQGQASQTAG